MSDSIVPQNPDNSTTEYSLRVTSAICNPKENYSGEDFDNLHATLGEMDHWYELIRYARYALAEFENGNRVPLRVMRHKINRYLTGDFSPREPGKGILPAGFPVVPQSLIDALEVK